jgi:hypothetical protein
MTSAETVKLSVAVWEMARPGRPAAAIMSKGSLALRMRVPQQAGYSLFFAPFGHLILEAYSCGWFS